MKKRIWTILLLLVATLLHFSMPVKAATSLSELGLNGANLCVTAVYAGEDSVTDKIRVDYYDSISSEYKELTLNQDYKIDGYCSEESYKASTDSDVLSWSSSEPSIAGSYYVKISGMGDYEGTLTTQYTVYAPNDVSRCSFVMSESGYTAGVQNSIGDVIKVYFYNKDDEEIVLEYGTDYEIIKYSTNTSDYWGDEESVNRWTDGVPSDPGTYLIVIQGIGDYTGTKHTSNAFTLTIRDSYDISIYRASMQKYSLGSETPITDGLSVYLLDANRNVSKTLEQSTDYQAIGYLTDSDYWAAMMNGSLSSIEDSSLLSEPTSTGTFWVKVEGIGSYHGSRWVNFTVVDPYSLDNYYIHLNRFAIGRDQISSKIKVTDSDELTDHDVYLTLDSDYEIVGYCTSSSYYLAVENNSVDSIEWSSGDPTEPGDYYLKINGLGKFEGKTRVSYFIAYDLHNLKNNAESSSAEYELKVSTLAENIHVKNWYDDDNDYFIDEDELEELVQATDYKIIGYSSEYDECEEEPEWIEGEPDSPGTYYVKVEGIGSYSGTTIVGPITVKKCEHNCQWTTKEASCSEEGTKTGHCTKCNEDITETIPKLSHTPSAAVEENRVEASCTKAGSYDEVVYCSVCKAEISRTNHKIDVLAHTPKTIPAKAASCTATGLTEGSKCSVCGEILKAQEETEKVAHTPETIPAKAASCTATGLTEGSKCSVCGEILKAQEETEKVAHTPETIPAKVASCSETGLTEGSKCSVCGEILKAQEETEKVAHTPETMPAKAASCSETGLTEGSKCSVCGEILKAQEKTEKTAHPLLMTISFQIVKEETCTEDGTSRETTVCAICNEEISSKDYVIPAKGHTAETMPAKAASCSETGLTEGSKCSVCGEILKAQEETEKLDHTPGQEVKEDEKASTCDKAGSYSLVVYCTVCDKELSRSEVTLSPTGHTWSTTGKITQKATCTTNGIMTYSCTKCDATTTKTIPATGHKAVSAAAVAPSVFKTGLTEGKYCSVCKAVLTRQNTVAKLKATIAVSKSKVTLKKKKSVTIKVSKLARGDSVKSWKSSNKAIASVNSKGKITAKKKGKTKVTVTLKSGKKAVIMVTVK